MIKFLRSLDLNPIDTNYVVGYVNPTTSSPTTIFDLITKGIEISEVVIALFTGDEWASLYTDLRLSPEPADQKNRWQARQNVILETGFAYAKNSSNVIIVTMGDVSLPTDLNGVHIFKLTNDTYVDSPRHKLMVQLRRLFNNKFVIPYTEEWKTKGDFEMVVPGRSQPLDPFLPT